MPESVTDRPTTAHEYVFLLSKSARYFWDGDGIRVANISASNLRTKANEKHNQAVLSPIGQGEREWNNPAGRNFRTSDPWLTSLDLAIADARAELAHLEAIKARGGLLADADGDPLALLVATAPYKGSHYAVFPTKLVEPLLLAAAPRERCSVCGAPWVRVVERTPMVVRPGPGRAGLQNASNGSSARTAITGKMLKPATSVTTGFAPTCDHDAPTAPGVVGDMFGGSGTVGRVAIEHGRDALLIELKGEYIDEHISKRTDKVQIRLDL